MTKRTRYGGEGCGWIWAGLRMRAYYYLGGNFQRKSMEGYCGQKCPSGIDDRDRVFMIADRSSWTDDR